MNVVHLTASTFFGGPERQMLGLARRLAPATRTTFLSFAEGGRCQSFLAAARAEGYEARALDHDTPRLLRAAREIRAELRRLRADVLCCHGYKADLLGRMAARKADVPVVAVSRGWTRESLKVRAYEALDRLNLRWMDRVVCVSQGQAVKVLRAGVPAGRVAVIRNAIDVARFDEIDSRYCQILHDCFHAPRRFVVGAAGRLSPEKGFGVFVEAARRVAARDRSVGFVQFGDGPLLAALTAQVEKAGLNGVFVLAGLRHDLDRFFPFLDLVVLPSFTEGLPNVVLEAFGAGVAVVATAVGGTPEVVEDGVSGYLVPPGDPDALARRILDAVADDELRQEMGRRGGERVRQHFTFEAQARAYERLFADLLTGKSGGPTGRVAGAGAAPAAPFVTTGNGKEAA